MFHIHQLSPALCAVQQKVYFGYYNFFLLGYFDAKRHNTPQDFSACKSSFIAHFLYSVSFLIKYAQ